MGRYTTFLDCKNQYFEKDYNIQSNLLIQSNLQNQITNGISHRIRTENFYNMYKNTKRSQISKLILRRKSGLPDFRLYYIPRVIKKKKKVWYWHKNRKYRSVEQDRKSWDKPKHLWSNTLWQRGKEYTMEKRQSLQWVVLRKQDSYM